MQHYASISAKLFLLLNTVFINDVALACQDKFKSARVDLVLGFVLFAALTTSQQAVAHNVANGIFKSQVSFHNYYLAYASSHGIGGGGGGGGHGAFSEVTITTQN
jgi:hypothetical protein